MAMTTEYGIGARGLRPRKVKTHRRRVEIAKVLGQLSGFFADTSQLRALSLEYQFADEARRAEILKQIREMD